MGSPYVQAAPGPLDVTSFLEDIVVELDEIPAELHQLFDQLKEKETVFAEISNTILQKQRTLRKYSKTPSVPGSQETRIQESILQSYDKAEALGKEKIELTQRILELLDKNINKIDNELSKSRPEWCDIVHEIQIKGQESLYFLKDIDIEHDKRVPESLVHRNAAGRFSRKREYSPKSTMVKIPILSQDEKQPKVSFQRRGRKSRIRDRSNSIQSGRSEPEEAETVDDKPYCYCHEASYGNMIGCDNKNCAIEWFHYECVGLQEAPDKWFCKECSQSEK